MAVKIFVVEGFSRGEITVTVSLHVERAFNSARWPSVLKKVTRKRVPTELIQPNKNYFNQRKATLAINNIIIEIAISKGPVKGLVCGTSFTTRY
jgi:hypothetical protein